MGRRFWLGVPLVAAGLLLTQVPWQRVMGQGGFPRQWMAHQSLPAPYRYPFDHTLSQGSPIVSVQREIAFHQQRVQESPNGALERAALATSYFKMGRATGVESWFLLAEVNAQQSLQQLPFDNGEALSVLARVAETRHDFTTALALAQQIPNPDEAIALQVTSNLAQGNLTAASEAVDRLVARSFSPGAFTLQGLVRMAQGQEEQALKSFHYALEGEDAGELGQSARIRTLLGRYAYERGDLERAGALYQEALRIWPDYPPALVNRAQWAIRMGQYGRARSDYERLKDTPSLYQSLALRGLARLQQLRGTSVDPSVDLSVDPSVDPSGPRQGTAQPLWDEAARLLRQGLDEPEMTFGHDRDLARLLLERGRPQDRAEAIALMEHEITHRRDGETLALYGWALVQNGQKQEARSLFQRAIAQNTKSAELLDRAVDLEESLGNREQAQRYRATLQTLDPQFDERARNALGLGLGLSFY